MNEEERKQFQQNIHIGDIVLIDYKGGFWTKTYRNKVGYVSEISQYSIELTNENKNPDGFSPLLSSDSISFEDIKSYNKLVKKE
jgi:hypothetical protein